MSVQNETYKVSYDGRGDTGPYPITFEVNLDDGGNAEDIVVKLLDSAGTETDITATSTITGMNVYTALIYSAAYEIVLIRYPTLTQPYTFPFGTKFPSRTFEKALDRNTFAIQRLALQSDQSLKGALSEVAPARLPSISDRANHFLGFDAAGDPIAADPTSIPVTPFMQTVLDDVDGDAARLTLKVGIETYDATKVYAVSWLVQYQGNFYKSLVSGNLGNTPSALGGYWDRYNWNNSYTMDASVALGDVIRKSETGWEKVPGTLTEQASAISGTWVGVRCIGLSATLAIIVYQESGQTRFVAVGIAADGTITWGTPVNIAQYYANESPSIDRLSATSFVCVYNNTARYNEAVVGTVSALAITLGSPVSLSAANTVYHPRVAALTSTSFIAVHSRGASTYNVKVVACTVSGNVITAGSETDLTGSPVAESPTNMHDIVRLTDTTALVSHNGISTSGFQIITVSGTTATPGTQYTKVATDGVWGRVRGVPMSSGQSMFVFTDSGTGYLNATVVRNSAGVVIFSGCPRRVLSYTVMGSYNRYLGGTSLDANRAVFVWLKWAPGAGSVYLSVIDADESWLTSTMEVEAVANGNYNGADVTKLSSNTFLLAYVQAASGNVMARVLSVSDVLGVASNGSVVPIVAHSGRISGLSGLIAGKEYYVQLDNRLSPVPWYPPARVGLAVSATEIIR